MKFLIHIPQLIYGGAEKVLVNFANVLVEHGHEVEILETYEKGLLKPWFDDRVKFNAICSKEYTKKYYASLEEIKQEKNPARATVKTAKLVFSKIVGYRKFAEKLAARYYKNKKYDVAINYLEIEDPQFIVKNINAEKYIQWIHTDVSKLPKGELDDFVDTYRCMDAVINASHTVQENMKKSYPELNNLYTIHNFFNIDEIQEKSKFKIDFGCKELVILSVGRLEAPKGYDRALNVIYKLCKEGYKFKWYIIGDGRYRTIIQNLIEEKSLDSVIHLLGTKDNPYPYIKQCDLFFLPSMYEGFPTVTIEAKVLKKPVLSTEVSGIREQIVSGKHGLIVENSEKGIYEGLKYILDNPMLLEKYSCNDGMDDVLDNSRKYKKFMELINGGMYEHNVLR